MASISVTSMASEKSRSAVRQRVIWLETNMTLFPPTVLYQRIQGGCSRRFGGRRSA
jgi:hypothetical protein